MKSKYLYKNGGPINPFACKDTNCLRITSFGLNSVRFTICLIQMCNIVSVRVLSGSISVLKVFDLIDI